MFHKVKTPAIALMIMLMVACADKEKIISHSITDVKIENTLENQKHFVTLSAHVGGPDLYFNGDIFDVLDPVTSQHYGALLILNSENEKNKLQLKINLDELKMAHSLNELTLPNKSAFPIQDYDSVLTVPIAEHSRAYLFKKNENYTLGLALVIPEFDPLIHQIPNSNLIFNLEGGSGVGGFFTSAERFQSGMLIFRPLDTQKRKWKTQSLTNKKFEALYKQIHSWQKKKTKFKVK